jgi:uncharacterized protein YdhG (YjbR/CyaY superfamily)
MRKFGTVKEYHALIPKEIRALVEELRDTIAKAAPQAELGISYNMPAFLWNGPVAYYAWYNHHIGFYPTGSPIPHFRDELKAYKTSRGAIQFPLDKPIPKSLVTRIVKFKLKENQEKAKAKVKTRPGAKAKLKAKLKDKTKAKA